MTTTPTKSVADLLEARKTIKYIPFEQWLAGLDHAALTYGFGRRLVADTGAETWRDYFEHGMTPKQALYEDLSYGAM